MNKLLINFENKKNKYDYVFFDIFDTIVTRNVEPEYIKKIWSKNLVEIIETKLTGSEIYEIRRELESLLCEKSKSEGYDLEFKYKELIHQIYNKIKNEIPTNISLKKFVNLCTELEIEIEANAQVVCEDTLELIKKIDRKNTKIICLSDMYLSSEMIKKIFEKKEILIYFDEFIMSSSFLLSKRTGRIYDHIISDLKLKSKKCIMIGDNQYSDYEMPISKGFDAIHIDMSHKKTFNDKFLNENNYINQLNKIELIMNEGKLHSFSNIAFSLYEFTEKLYFSLLKKDATNVVFFSREGQFLKKLFDEYQSKSLNKKIKTHYALVSRKSTYIASLKSLDKEDFSSLLDQYSYNSIMNFIQSLNFNKMECKLVRKELKKIIDVDEKVHYFKDSINLKKLRKNTTFAKIYDKKRLEQKEFLQKYFEEFEIDYKDTVFIVDIGWKGSIQSNIQRTLSERNIYGYYFGLLNSNKTDDREGLIFSNNPHQTENFNLYNENRSLYEIILGADHGSALNYVKRDNKIVALTYETKEEKDLYKKIIAPIQKDIFKKFVLISEVVQDRLIDKNDISKKFNLAHYKMLFLPNKEQRDFFNRIYHYENFGVFEYTNFSGKHNYKGKIVEFLKYILKNKIYTSDYYWPQLKNYNNGVLMIAKLYALQRYVEFKRKNIL
jgi:HAD superfamily hydrolase (TIGR01549 family)